MSLDGYQAPELTGDWSADEEHRLVGSVVESVDGPALVASVWTYGDNPERADVKTDDGVTNVAWDRLEVLG